MKHTGTFSVRTLNPGDCFLVAFHWRRVVRVRTTPTGELEILHARPIESGGLEYRTYRRDERVEVGII
jgi:hypothetical protein